MKGGESVNEIKDKVFSLRLSKTEYEYLKRQAEENHITISAYIRMRVLKGNEWKMNFYNHREGETLEQALNRIHTGMFEKSQKEREEKELEERLYNRLLQ